MDGDGDGDAFQKKEGMQHSNKTLMNKIFHFFLHFFFPEYLKKHDLLK